MGRTRLFLLFITTGLILIVVYLILDSGEEGSKQGAIGRIDVSEEPYLTNAGERQPAVSSPPVFHPTQTPQPLYPTRTPFSLSQTGAQSETRVPDKDGTSLPDIDVSPCPLANCLPLFGVSGPGRLARLSYQAGLPFSAYLSWSVEEAPDQPGGVSFWQLVNVNEDGPVDSLEKIARAANALPGSIWIIGNEPDVIWQNNVPPDRYALVYHDLYQFIKEQDSSAKVAIGGVAQPTPLRLRYLELVLDTYMATYGQPMPVDIWTIHGFILQEMAGSWGVEIPPGMPATQGQLYTIQDHGDLEIFKRNLVDFREWMANRGYRDKPLALTEFGILLPSDYGFPEEDVAAFMVGAIEFLVAAANESGYPPENGRLVQWWFWFSINDAGGYQTGDLYDPGNDQLTYLGQIYAAYVHRLSGAMP